MGKKKPGRMSPMRHCGINVRDIEKSWNVFLLLIWESQIASQTTSGLKGEEPQHHTTTIVSHVQTYRWKSDAWSDSTTHREKIERGCYQFPGPVLHPKL
jgi:hypothetical protein